MVSDQDDPDLPRIGSPDWTRTSTRPVNSRLLSHLSFGGMNRADGT